MTRDLEGGAVQDVTLIVDVAVEAVVVALPR